MSDDPELERARLKYERRQQVKREDQKKEEIEQKKNIKAGSEQDKAEKEKIIAESDEILQNSDALAEYKRGLLVPREHKKKKEKEWKEKIKVESGEVIRKVPITAITLDPNVYPPSERREPLVEEHLELLLAGQKLSPVKVMKIEPETPGTKKQYLLVDGHAVWKAHQKRAKLYKDGKLSTSLRQDEIETIPVELVDAPVHQKAGQNLRSRIRKFYQQFPGCPVSGIAKEMGCDIKTAKKYSADLIMQWEQEEMKLIKDMNSQGKSNREIAKALKDKWPWASGLSQAVINRLIKKNL